MAEHDELERVEQCSNPHCARRIQQLEDELSRLRSVGFDMLKQRGSWLAGGVDPQELGMEFDCMFTHEIEDVSEVLTKESEMTEAESRQFLSTSFQDVFNTCKEAMLDQMRDSLSRVLVLPEEQDDDEELYDIARAYGLLVSVCGKAGPTEHKACAAKVHSKLPLSTAPDEFNDLLDEMSRFSWKLLEMVPPLFSGTIYDSPFCKDWHVKEAEPEWNRDLKDFLLVYYRPILFFSCEGKVSQKAWVGNRPVPDGQDKPCAESTGNGEYVKSKKKEYKKPRLKVRVPRTANPCNVVPDKPVSPPIELKSDQNEERTSESDPGSYYFGLRKLL